MTPADLVSITVSPGGATPEGMLNVDLPGPRGYFADDDGAVGWFGAAATVTADDLGSLPRLHLPDGDGDPPRAFAVARFARDPRDAKDPAWRELPGAAMVLPRLTVTRRGGETVARWILPRGEPIPDIPSRTVVLNEHEAIAAHGDRDAWTRLVEEALAAMRGGPWEKIVAARRVVLGRTRGWDGRLLLDAMAARAAPGTTRFAFGYDGALFVGATPETLVARDGRTLRTEALAGSLPRDPSLDPRDRAALLGSEKDRREHALVAAMIRETVAPWCATLDAPETPAVKSLRALHHLHTPFAGALRDDAPDLLAMAAALHPTPAVAGTPAGAAVSWLAAHEPEPRGWYAGPVGWIDARGDGRFVVGIRSAVIRGERAWVYAGAGLVPGSEAAREWEETAVKMSLMREALGA